MPEVEHGRARPGAPDPAPFVALSVQRAVESLRQPDEPPVGLIVGGSRLRRFVAQTVEQLFIPLEIGVDSGEVFFRGDGLFVVDVFLHGGHGVRGAGNARPVDAEIVVDVAL